MPNTDNNKQVGKIYSPQAIVSTDTLDDILKRFAADLDDAMEYSPTEEKVNRAISKAKAALLQRERDIRIDEVALAQGMNTSIDGKPTDKLIGTYFDDRIAELQSQSSKGGE